MAMEALLWRDGPPSVLALVVDATAWMLPPQISAWAFCVEAPPRVEFCGLTTENRAGFSRVGLRPDCGFAQVAGLET